MDYWPTARWKMAISGGESEQWIEPSLPFALIGSHGCCAGHIPGKRVPEVVYLACCFSDSIEVWPVCPIAFPRWGIVEPQHELLAGRKRIGLIHQSHHSWEKIATRGSHPDPSAIITATRKEASEMLANESPPSLTAQITIDWDGKVRPRRLFRRVTIVGDDHPSTLRLHAQGMQQCDHAIVADGESVWLINLNPPPGAVVEDLVVRLRQAAEPTMIGQVKVGLGQAGEDRPVSPREKVNVQQAAHARQAADDMGPRTSGPHTLSTSGTTHEATPEDLTSQITDRLVSIDHAKSTRKRIVMISLYIAGFILAASLLVWFVTSQLLPMIPEPE